MSLEYPDPRRRHIPRNVAITVVFVLIVIVLVGMGTMLLRPSPPTPVRYFSETQFDMIEANMSLAQVGHILGKPPGTYTTKREFTYTFQNGPLDQTLRYELWADDEHAIGVWFGQDGTVHTKIMAPIDDVPEMSLWDRLFK